MSLLKTTCKAADKIRIMSGRVAWRHSVEQSVCDCVTVHVHTAQHHKHCTLCVCVSVKASKCCRCHIRAVSQLNECSKSKSNITFEHWKVMKKATIVKWIKEKNLIIKIPHDVCLYFFKAWPRQNNCRVMVDLCFSVPGSCGRGSRRGWDPACSSGPAHSSPGLRYWRPPPGQNPETLSFTFSEVKQLEMIITSTTLIIL